MLVPYVIPATVAGIYGDKINKGRQSGAEVHNRRRRHLRELHL